MDADRAVARARELFLDDDNVYGCAETALVVLGEAFDLPASGDSSAAMALNGGVAYGGGICGAISGAALAVGMLAGRRLAEHREAKRVAGQIVGRVMDRFEVEHGAVTCRQLLGIEIRTRAQHDAFIASNVWRDRCMRQIEFVVAGLAPLADEAAWLTELEALEEPQR